MVEKTNRAGSGNEPRAADGRRFEVFVRETEADPLQHVGTVAAPTPDVAHEEASKLFAWYARDVWICPAEETHRYSAASLAADDEDEQADEDGANGGEQTEGNGASGDDGEDGTSGGEQADGDGMSGSDDGNAGEPRVYEETEGTPTVACGGAPIEPSGDSREQEHGDDGRDR